MAAAGNTPIQLYYSNTAGNAPVAANLISGELAINMADGLLFFKDSTNTVSVLASRNTANVANTVFVQANAAFLQANSAYASQNVSGTYANSAYAQANSASLYANGAFTQANAAYTSQNASGSYANSAYYTANSAQLYANGAFVQANAAYGSQNVSGSYANSAYAQANSASLYANGAFAQANAAYASGNVTGIYANTAFAYANSAGLYANGAFTTANLALPKAGGTITGSLTVNQDVTVQGNLSVLGNSTIIYTASLELTDSLIYLANGNFAGDAVDIGFIGHYNAGSNAHTGLIRDPSLKEYIFFQGYAPEVQSNNLINTAHPSFGYANVYANVFKGDVIANNISVSGYNVFTYITNAYTQANSAYGSQNTTGSYANSAFTQANSAYASQNVSGSYANSAYYTANSAQLYANGAFTQANAAYGSQNVSGSYANSAYYTANSAQLYANGAFIQANAAYGSQNVTGTYANAAYYTANSAQTYANSAFSYANSAYALANTHLVRDNWLANTVITANSTGTLGNSGMTYNRDTSTLVLGVTGPSGNLAIGTTTATAPITINKTYSATTGGEQFGIYTGVNYNVADTSLKQGIRINNNAAHTTGTMSSIIGVLSLSSASGVGGNTSELVSFWARTDPVAGATVSNAYSFVSNNHGGTGAANTQFGFYAGGLSKGLFNNYGFYGSVAPTSPTSNNSYNLYMAGLAPNYLAGSLTVANNVPSTSVSTGGLVVNGGMGLSGNLYSSNIYVTGASNGITFPDGSIQVTSFAAAASYANAAFIKANSAYASDNVTGTYANSAYYTANSAQIYANGAFLQANAAYGSQNVTGTYANAAFAFANSAGSYANSAFTYANSAGSYANSGFAVANSASIYANGAFTTANNAVPKAGGTMTGNLVLSGVNTNITFADGTTQNTATKFVSINNLFERKTYIATQGQTGFNINYTPDPSGNNVFLHINGTYIDPTEFTALTGTSILLTTPALSGDVVDIAGYRVLGVAVNNQIMMTSVPTINVAYGTAGDYTDITKIALAQSFIV